MASPEAPLELRGVTAAYGRRDVLHGLDVSVGAGEIVAVLGHNGAGKTTALWIAAGLKAPSAGSVRLFGSDVGRMGASRRARAGMALVPEGVAGLFGALTVRQNLEAIERPGADDGDPRWAQLEARVHDAFHEVLVDRLDQVAGSMSGGQRQMLAISMALLRRPRVLLLDEPSTGLAPIVVEKIFDVVAGVVETGTAVLLVEQDVAHALAIAGRIVIVRSGAVVAQFARDDCPPATELWRFF